MRDKLRRIRFVSLTSTSAQLYAIACSINLINSFWNIIVVILNDSDSAYSGRVLSQEFVKQQTIVDRFTHLLGSATIVLGTLLFRRSSEAHCCKDLIRN